MTTLSQYLKVERFDVTEPVDFYVPGLHDWRQLKTARGKAAMATRSRAPEEKMYPVETEDEVEQ